MDNSIKNAALFLVLLLAVSTLTMLTAAPANAQSIPKPSIPEFTLKLIDHSYDVPSSTTTITDPYTGQQTVTTHPGYHVQNKTIEVRIKNPQFTAYAIDNKHTAYLSYNISYKGHYENDWKYYPQRSFARDSTATHTIPKSASDYTVVPFRAPTEGQMDFRVQAQIGYYTEHLEWVMVPGAPFSTYLFTGEVSGFSNTQTITMPDGSASENQTATPEQSSPQNIAILGLDWMQLAALVLLGVIAVLLVVDVFLRKQSRK